MMQYRYFVSQSGNAWENMAYDEYLIQHLPPEEICLLFYINTNAVIIGQNQNPYLECNLAAMEEDGVQLARRVSGGGAVYHDGGNLNFSLHVPTALYDRAELNAFILEALRALGIDAAADGRNDLTVAGRKVSGHAFCQKGSRYMHHGTLLVDADLSRMGKYLTVSKKKLEAKGVKSVHSRVANLTQYVPDLTVPVLLENMIDAFRRAHSDVHPLTFSETELEAIAALTARHAGSEWRFGETPAFTYTLESRFDFGTVQFCLNVEQGKIIRCRVYTDSLDLEVGQRLEAVLTGAVMDPAALSERLSDAGFEQVAAFFRGI